MALEKFVDEQGTELNSFILEHQDGTSEEIKLLRNANITQVGTPLNAETLNKLVDGINAINQIEYYSEASLNTNINVSLPITGLINGMRIKLYMKDQNNANYVQKLGAVTLNVNSLGQKPVCVIRDGKVYQLTFLPYKVNMVVKYNNTFLANKDFFEIISFDGSAYNISNRGRNYEINQNGRLKITGNEYKSSESNDTNIEVAFLVDDNKGNYTFVNNNNLSVTYSLVSDINASAHVGSKLYYKTNSQFHVRWIGNISSDTAKGVNFIATGDLIGNEIK